MKKFIATLLAGVAALATISFASCSQTEDIKVMKDILLTEEDY